MVNAGGVGPVGLGGNNGKALFLDQPFCNERTHPVKLGAAVARIANQHKTHIGQNQRVAHPARPDLTFDHFLAKIIIAGHVGSPLRFYVDWRMSARPGHSYPRSIHHSSRAGPQVAVRAEFHPAVRDTPLVGALASPLAVSPALPVAPAHKAHHQPRALPPFVQSFQIVSP
jgi:hypothetical protein